MTNIKNKPETISTEQEPENTVQEDNENEQENAELADEHNTEEDEIVNSENSQTKEDEPLIHVELSLSAKVEAILFASQKPIKAQEIYVILDDDELSPTLIDECLVELFDFYKARNSGVIIKKIGKASYQFQTSVYAGSIMERMFASRPRPISRAALETLSIIAYRQPVTRAEIEFIRGVDAGSIFRSLLERGLIDCVGRKEAVGRPMLFGTTAEFLKVFGLSKIKDLPPLASFQPNPEMVGAAKTRLETEDTVDIEKYIADNVDSREEDSVEGDSDIDLAGATMVPDSDEDSLNTISNNSELDTNNDDNPNQELKKDHLEGATIVNKEKTETILAENDIDSETLNAQEGTKPTNFIAETKDTQEENVEKQHERKD